MRWLVAVGLCLVLPAVAQDRTDAGRAAVAAVLDQYTVNPLARVPETHGPLPSGGTWSIRTSRPESCPKDDSPCVGVIYSVPAAHVACAWTVAPGLDGAPATFLEQNEDASRYLLRRLSGEAVAALVVKRPQPMYPSIARAARLAGPVVVRIVVSEKGTVTSATAIRGAAMLQGAAIDTAQHWVFQPLRVGAQAAPFTADLSADFVLQPVSGGMPAGTATMRP